MKKYLIFQTDGLIIEKTITITNINIIYDNYHKYEFKNNYYIIIIEPNINLNISNIPFIKNDIYGTIKMFKVNNFIDFKLKSLSEICYFKIINTNIDYLDYSSDDFNPDTCKNINSC